MKISLKIIILLNIAVILALSFLNPNSGYSAQEPKRYYAIDYVCDIPPNPFMYIRGECEEHIWGPYISCTRWDCRMQSYTF